MTEVTDHDLLITLVAKVDMMAGVVSDFVKATDARQSSTERRLSTMETKDRGDSEKVRALTEQLQRTLNNADRITNAFIKIETTQTEILGIKEDVKDLKTKSNIFDVANAILATASGIIGFIFGNK